MLVDLLIVLGVALVLTPLLLVSVLLYAVLVGIVLIVAGVLIGAGRELEQRARSTR